MWKKAVLGFEPMTESECATHYTTAPLARIFIRMWRRLFSFTKTTYHQIILVCIESFRCVNMYCDISYFEIHMKWTQVLVSAVCNQVTEVNSEQYSTMLQTIEWLDWCDFLQGNRIFGARLFIFYIDNSFSNNATRRLLAKYEQRGIVETIHWQLPEEVQGYAHKAGQHFTLNDCGYRLMYRAKHLLQVDIDELLVPMKVDNWTALIYNIMNVTTGSEKIASFNFRHRYFPLEEPDTFNLLPNEVQRQLNGLASGYRFQMLSRTMCENQLLAHGQRGKIMGLPEKILLWNIHYLQKKHLVRMGFINFYVRGEDAELQHYRIRHEKYKKLQSRTCPRLLNFTTQFIRNLNESITGFQTDWLCLRFIHDVLHVNIYLHYITFTLHYKILIVAFNPLSNGHLWDNPILPLTDIVRIIPVISIGSWQDYPIDVHLDILLDVLLMMLE